MNKNYLIIGGSSGIGLSVVEQLLQEGHRVIVIARQQRNLPQHDQLKFFSHDITTGPLPAILEPLDGLVFLPGTITLKPFS